MDGNLEFRWCTKKMRNFNDNLRIFTDAVDIASLTV